MRAGRHCGRGGGHLPPEKFCDPGGRGSTQAEPSPDILALGLPGGVVQPLVEVDVYAFIDHEFESCVLQPFFFVVTGLDVGDQVFERGKIVRVGNWDFGCVMLLFHNFYLFYN